MLIVDDRSGGHCAFSSILLNGRVFPSSRPCRTEALEKIQSEKPDLVLDIMLPDISGIRVSRANRCRWSIFRLFCSAGAPGGSRSKD